MHNTHWPLQLYGYWLHIVISLAASCYLFCITVKYEYIFVCCVVHTKLYIVH